MVLSRSQMPQTIRDAVDRDRGQALLLPPRCRPSRDHPRRVRRRRRRATIVEGGSTITQQLVKQLYVGDDETFERKIDEALLAWQLEDQLTKDQILTKYLNTVYFGQGAYGIQAAARSYFAIDAKDLTLSQSALLAGLIRAPNDFDPFAHPGARSRSAEHRAALDARPGLDRGRGSRRGRRPSRSSSTRSVAGSAIRSRTSSTTSSNGSSRTRRSVRRARIATSSCSPAGCGSRPRSIPRSSAPPRTRSAPSSPYPEDPSGAMTVIDPRTGYVRAHGRREGRRLLGRDTPATAG